MTTTCSTQDTAPPGPAPFADIVWIAGRTFEMGFDQRYPDERPVHRVSVDGFCDGFRWTSPVDAFAPNGYGVFDMIGNAWEMTTDWYQPRQPEITIPRKVLKGGSHLRAPEYCRRYRPAARVPEPIDTSTCHVGFRCVVRPPRN